MSAGRVVRVSLDRAVRLRRERQHSTAGICVVGGVHFLDGVAYVPAGSTLVQRLRSGSWHGATVAEAVDATERSAHEARLDGILHPPDRAPEPCHPARGAGTPLYESAYCHGGHVHGDGCRELYPDNFPPPPVPAAGVGL